MKLVSLILVAIFCFLPLGFATASELASISGHLPTTTEPGHEKPPTTEIPEGQFDFSIPAPRKTPVPKDVETLHFLIKKITIEGSSVFQHGDLLPLVEQLIGQEASLNRIMAVAEAIEARYREEGFVMTRVFVPPQHSKDGDFKIQVVEGFVMDIVVNGVDGLLKERIAATLSPVQQEMPLTMATVERALLLVNDIPGIKAVGLLKPNSEALGAADLEVNVTRESLSASAGADNRSSRYSGPWITNTDFAFNSLLNTGEKISGGLSRSIDGDKQRGYHVSYTQPLGSNGLTSVTSLERTLGHPGYTLSPLGLNTDSLTIGERLAYPIIRSRTQNLLVEGGFTVKSARTSVMQANVSNDQWRVADIRLSWSNNGWADGLTAASFGMAKGVSVMGGSRSGQTNLSRANADPGFTKFIMDAKRLQMLSPEWSVMVAATGQYALDRLLAGEEFSLGGGQFGRGFDPAALTGDHGIGGTFEIHFDPLDPLPLTSHTLVYVFYDQGIVWDGAGPASSTLSSVGLGLKASFASDIDAGLEFSRPLHGPEATVKNGPGRVYFSLQGRF